MRVPVVVGFLLLALAAAPAARADVTIGSTLDAAPNGTVDVNGTVSATAIPDRLVAAPSGGVITRWSISANLQVVPTRLVVIRRPAGTGANPGEVVARSAPFTPDPNVVSTVPARLRIAAGDYIGIECCAAGAQGGYLYVAPGSGTVDIWSPPLDEFVPANPTTPSSSDRELLVSAAIEPDLDGDGFGDETQDPDDDGDGVEDAPDNCDAAANPGQEDADGDGAGDACDDDRDGDGVPNTSDACPGVAGTASNGCTAPPPTPRVNQPPVVRFRTPMAGTAVRTSQTIELEVSDDAGPVTVTLFDDDGTICTVSAAPYSCTWKPTGADVGRATLLASAVDSEGRSTLGIVRVRVSRFKADLTVRRRGRRVSGRLVLPAAVERSLGCAGQVTVTRRKIRRTVALKRNCTYAVRLPRGSGTPRARFAGNPVVEPAT